MANIFKTFILMSALTGLFLVAGQALGGKQGMMFALLMAVGMNFFAYWFSDKMALAMGAPLSANLILIGFASQAMPEIFSFDNLNSIVTKLSPERFLAQNQEALKAGFDAR